MSNPTKEEFELLKARNAELFDALASLLKGVQTTKETMEYCDAEQFFAERALSKTWDFTRVTDYVTKEESLNAAVKAVSTARKSWAKQGAPWVKALHGAEIIRQILDGDSGRISVDILLEFAEQLEKEAESEGK